MACEDFPCCGHELGCCPDFDPETGKQLNMRCTCGAVLPINNRSSLCRGCLHDPDCYGCSECEPNDEDDEDEDDGSSYDRDEYI